jgi:hypothetical protein
MLAFSNHAVPPPKIKSVQHPEMQNVTDVSFFLVIE